MYTAGSEWPAAAGEGGTANRDWCSWHLGIFLAPPAKYCCFVFAAAYQLIVFKSVNDKPVSNSMSGTSGLIERNTRGMEEVYRNRQTSSCCY